MRKKTKDLLLVIISLSISIGTILFTFFFPFENEDLKDIGALGIVFFLS